MPEQHILIIGAGICGLAIAHGFKKNGIPYTIFEGEERSTFRPREWTMALHWSIAMLKDLLPVDLGARIQSDAAVDPSLDYSKPPANTVPMIDGVTGKTLKELEVEGDYLRVSRRRLRTLCAQGIDIQWGSVLQDISYHDNGVEA